MKDIKIDKLWLMQGDCLERMKDIPSGSVDMVLTDPPYGMGDLKGAHSPTHDVVWMATKGRPTFSGKRPQSIIRSKRPSPSQDNGHPTCKPADLMVQLMQPWGCEMILDPFMGSGSTVVAAVNTGRKFIGIELDDKYYDTAVNRIVGALV